MFANKGIIGFSNKYFCFYRILYYAVLLLKINSLRLLYLIETWIPTVDSQQLTENQSHPTSFQQLKMQNPVGAETRIWQVKQCKQRASTVVRVRLPSRPPCYTSNSGVSFAMAVPGPYVSICFLSWLITSSTFRFSVFSCPSWVFLHKPTKRYISEWI